jgi:hypothetical protein
VPFLPFCLWALLFSFGYLVVLSIHVPPFPFLSGRVFFLNSGDGYFYCIVLYCIVFYYFIIFKFKFSFIIIIIIIIFLFKENLIITHSRSLLGTYSMYGYRNNESAEYLVRAFARREPKGS